MANTAAAIKDATPVALDNYNKPTKENIAENNNILVILKR